MCERRRGSRGSVHWRSLLNLKSRMASPSASAAFAVPLPVLVVNDRDGVQHRGTLQLPRRAPAAAPGRPSSADLARLRPLMRALGDALAAQEEGLDPERLSRTYAALMAELQEVAGMGVHAVELTPATLAHVLPEGEEEDEEDEEGDEKGKAQLAALPEGLRALSGELRELAVQSTRLAVVPGWVGELTRLEALEVSGVEYDPNSVLKSLPASLGQLGSLKQLTLAFLDELEVLPDAVVRLTSLGSLTIDHCGKLRALPRGIGKLGALRELTLEGLDELQEMPDLIGLTALGSLTIKNCFKLRALPRGIGKLGALKKLTLLRLNELQEMPDTIGRMTALEHLTLDSCSKLRTLPASIMHLSRLQTLCISEVPLEDMPCIEALTALHELRLDVADYAHGSRAFTALSRSLPCLQQLQVLGLGASGVVALQAGDVLAIGRALKAWPLPLLHDVEGLLRLSTCWRALGLPGAAADEDWTNATTLDYFRVQQQKVAAFASGMHWRLGAASGVSWLDEQALVMIADEVLGGWGLLKEWRQELVAAKV